VDLEQGIIWAYRLFLNREPESTDVIAFHAKACRDANDIRNIFLNSPEFGDQLATALRLPSSPEFPVDPVEGVRWAFRLLLQREPSEDEVAGNAPHLQSIRAIRRAFLLSREFELRGGIMRALTGVEVLNHFAPAANEPAKEGAFRDFLGNETRVSFLPPEYAAKSGKVDAHPSQSGIHGLPEWVGTLRSVVEARGQVTAMELGAGWAPWLVSVATAARKLGHDKVKLIAVEGSAEHFGYVRQHFLDNGLDPDAHELLHAVVGVEDGIARFPKLHSASEDYGANAVFAADGSDQAPGRGELEEIRSVGLSSLIERTGQVDLIHIDIQGHEEVVLRSAIGALDEHVRRIVIGTHSRSIEAALLDLFSEHGWINEHEQPCVITQLDDGHMHLNVDGEQVWRNSRFS